jgi:hypothetical protein
VNVLNHVPACVSLLGCIKHATVVHEGDIANCSACIPLLTAISEGGHDVELKEIESRVKMRADWR